MAIDAGGLVGSPVDVGERVLLPVLRARRRRAIDVLVLTHPHPDHYGGLGALLERLPVSELWISGVELDSPASGALGAALRAAGHAEVRLRTAAELCGAPILFGAAGVEVLAPCPRYRRERPANDNSLVLRLSLGRRAALLVGDAERAEEEELLRAGAPRLAADFLKIGHHGSRTSTSQAFLDAVAPSAAAISCGARNRFGHPHPETTHRLAARGIEVLRTDRDGAVRWQTDGDSARLSAALP
jgi:competence protein ComEC